MTAPLIIAIDGPSGSGKSTLGRMLARELGLLYIDTGSMYRAVALAVIESTVNESDDVAVGSLAERIDIDLGGNPDSLRVSLNGQDVTERVRAEEVTRACDLFLAIGSSLVVWPAAGFPLMAKRNGARLAIINRETTEFDAIADLVVHEDIGAVLSPLIAH